MALQSAGLKTAIWNNNLKSALLLAIYPLLIGGVIWTVAWVAGHTLTPDLGRVTWFSSGSLSEAQDLQSLQPRPYSAVVFANSLIYAYWPLILAGVGIWFLMAFFFHTRLIRMMSRANPATRQSDPELYDMLEKLCISRGVTIPRLEIIETRARNAFASGITDKTFTITFTRGLLHSLRPDEVEAVMAHELAHIMNKDVRLLIISVIFTGMVGFFCQMVWNSIRFNSYRRRGKTDGRVVIMLFAVGVILWIGYMATMVTRFAISRRREYMADAGAIELTKNPDAMMRALLRIAGRDRIPETTDDIALMCIENSKPFLSVFSTHPPIDRRLMEISRTTNTPVPDISAGISTEDETRFQKTDQKSNPWLTSQRKINRNPWK